MNQAIVRPVFGRFSLTATVLIAATEPTEDRFGRVAATCAANGILVVVRDAQYSGN